METYCLKECKMTDDELGSPCVSLTFEERAREGSYLPRATRSSSKLSTLDPFSRQESWADPFNGALLVHDSKD